MNESEREEAVLEFLERRADGERLSPQEFVARRGADARLLDAVRAALAAEEQLAGAGPDQPRSFGPYEVVSTLGRGGMGTVYEVRRGGERLALKRAHGTGERTRARFEREARMLASIDHPSVVRVVAFEVLDGEPCLVMELVEGRALPAAAAELDARAAAALVAELCDAFDSVHARGLLHRDVKPQNVLLRTDGTPVLVDFGLGAGEDEASLTSTGDLLGTPRYMAPEVARGGEAGVAADVWGLGQVLYELCVGRPAVAEGTRAAVLREVAAARVADPRRAAPQLPRALCTILRSALAARPGRRYASAAEMGRDLRRFLAGEAVLARPPGPLTRRLDEWREEPRRALPLVSGLAVALLALAIVLGVQRSEAATRRSQARRHLERAVVAWSLGEVTAARRALESAARYGEREATTRVAAGLSADGGALDLAGLDAARHLLPVLRARALRLDGELEAARELLTSAPDSGAARAESATLWRAQGDRARAVGELREAVRLDPDDPLLARLLAEELLAAGEPDEGVALARDALRRATQDGRADASALPRLLGRAADPGAQRAALRRRLERDPGESDTRFALAVLLDADHALDEAAATYEELLRRDPRHAWGAAYLAHLRAGADRARCELCRETFGQRPELVDRQAAADLLASALTADRGQDQDLLRLVVYLARDHDLVQAARAAIADLLDASLDPVARVRLQEALGGLRPGPADAGSAGQH